MLWLILYCVIGLIFTAHLMWEDYGIKYNKDGLKIGDIVHFLIAGSVYGTILLLIYLIITIGEAIENYITNKKTYVSIGKIVEKYWNYTLIKKGSKRKKE